MPTETTFKGFDNIGEALPSEILVTNLIYYLDWSFLDKGAYYNVTIPTSGVYGGDKHRLEPVDDPRYTDGRVWQGFRSNWIWESGTAQPIQPIRVSGVYVGGVFHPNGSDHYIDYPNGQVIFNSAIALTANVQANYSFRYVNVYNGDDIPWFREMQFNSLRPDNSHFTQFGSGDWSQLPQNRVQLPAILIETGDANQQGYQLGGGHWCNTDVVFHVFAEDGATAKKIADVLFMQNDKTIFGFDLDLVAAASGWPLTYRGELANNPKTYPRMIATVQDGGYRWRKLRFHDTILQKGTPLGPTLYQVPVRTTVEIALTEI